MPPEVALQNMKMNDSPFGGQRPLEALGVVLLVLGRAGSRDNPLTPSASSPLF